MPAREREVWVTGIGLLTAAGVGIAPVAALLSGGTITSAGGKPEGIDEAAFAPYPVHRLPQIDFGSEILSKSEQRQMGLWQRIGVFAAGLALTSAGLKGQLEILNRTDLIVAAGNGERDLALDQRILETMPGEDGRGAFLNAALAGGLRPTLYLGELSNLLAGNIQIVHKVTGSSRTLKGEEMAGVSAIENAVRRIGAGQGDVFLVGGALNAERADLLLNYELGGNLWSHAFAPVWERQSNGGGFVPGSMAVFLVLESRQHAQARGAMAYARLVSVCSDRTKRTAAGNLCASIATLFKVSGAGVAPGPLAVLSGASGVASATAEERDFLRLLDDEGYRPAIRAYGSRFGHGVEAHFPLGIALAALALAAGRFYPPHDSAGVEKALDGPLERALVTGVGHWRGEGLALVERVDAAREVV